MLDLELHRAKVEAERLELSAQINVLSREMVLEKRLGMAQLLALVVLLFFVILTRGSPTTPFLPLPDPRSTISPAFPRSTTRHHRPRSVIDMPRMEGSAPLSGGRESISLQRERRSHGADRKTAPLSVNTANGLSRTGSMKRPAKLSNGARRPFSPSPATPRANSDNTTAATALTISLVETPGVRLPATAPVLSTIFTGPSAEPPSLPQSIEDIGHPSLSLAAAILDSPAVASPMRSSPVEAIRRKLRLLQPRRAASLDGSEAVPLPPRPQTATAALAPQPSRKLFAFSNSRRRSLIGTMDDDGEATSKAWLSTSEESADEASSEKTSSFRRLSLWSSNPSPSKRVSSSYEPPSPEPSDAER